MGYNWLNFGAGENVVGRNPQRYKPVLIFEQSPSISPHYKFYKKKYMYNWTELTIQIFFIFFIRITSRIYLSASSAGTWKYGDYSTVRFGMRWLIKCTILRLLQLEGWFPRIFPLFSHLGTYLPLWDRWLATNFRATAILPLNSENQQARIPPSTFSELFLTLRLL